MLRRTILLACLPLAACATLGPKLETELDSNRMAYAMAGEGPVTVVFEAGLGDGMDTWEPVFDRVASFATAFAYDRPGYGGSEDVSGSRTGWESVERLRALLSHVELTPPYLLVGHSLGGVYVQLYAQLYPEEVAGVALVDSRHPGFTERCRERLSGGCDPPALMRLLMPGHMKREYEGTDETVEQIREAGPFPEIQLVVLSRGTGDESREWLELWAETQRELAAMSPTSVHIVSERSGHYVHHDDPEAVIEAVRGLMERAAGARTGSES